MTEKDLEEVKVLIKTELSDFYIKMGKKTRMEFSALLQIMNEKFGEIDQNYPTKAEVSSVKDILLEVQNFMRNEFVLFREQLYSHDKRITNTEIAFSDLQEENTPESKVE